LLIRPAFAPPRPLDVQGFDIAKKAALEFAAELKVPVKMTGGVPDRDVTLQVARTALRTKLHTQLADQARRPARSYATLRCELTRGDSYSPSQLTDIVVDAVELVHRPEVPIDLHMVEVRAACCKRQYRRR
jgi:T-complex protein 1 subunit zeta